MVLLHYFVEIEVYEFPDDCNVEELKAHFERKPFLALSHSAQRTENSFILEYSLEGKHLTKSVCLVFWESVSVWAKAIETNKQTCFVFHFLSKPQHFALITYIM